MNQKSILFILAAIVLSVILLYSFNEEPQSDESYFAQIEQKRKDNNYFMKTAQDSPLEESKKANFKSLSYFTPNKTFKVKARLIPIETDIYYSMPLSNGSEEKYIKYAYAEFELEEETHRLLLLRSYNSKNPKKLFLAFGDLTNGGETYGGGRYIDLEAKNKNFIYIDFNLAYNPYCVYNHKYSCPLPPQENMLEIAIQAGEKMYDTNEK